MTSKRLIFSILILLFSMSYSLIAQDERTEYLVHFRVGEAVVRKNFHNNDSTISQLINHLNASLQDSTISVVKVRISGHTSPEGAYQRNVYLSGKRVEAVVNIIKEEVPRISNSIEITEEIIPYDRLKSYFEHSDLDEDIKAGAMEILSKEMSLIPYRLGTSDTLYVDARLVELAEYDEGREWRRLERDVFPQLRHAHIYVDTYNKELPLPSLRYEQFPITRTSVVRIEPVMIAQTPAKGKEKEERYDRSLGENLTIKTNGVGWAMLIPNIAIEYDYSQHFSLSIPFYYSGGYDYFSTHTKFRGIVLQPEVRYYFNPNHNIDKSFFLGAHLGVGWYNYALPGKYRIQAHKGYRPAFGGGISCGYALQFKRAPHFGLEFTLGAGVYNAKYDTFYNEPNGAYHQVGVKKTFFGIDNAAVSFTYKLFTKKGGER